MTSPALDNTQGRTTSALACHNRLWAAHTVERRRGWHAIIAYGRQTRSNDVKCDMPSPPLDSTHGQTLSGVACYRHLWAAHTVKRCWAWHSITAFGQHIWSDDVEGDMPSQPMAAHTVGRRRAWHAIIAIGKHTRSNDVGFGMPSSPLGSTRSNDVGRGITSPPFESTHD